MECKCKEIGMCREDKFLLSRAKSVIEGMYSEAAEIETRLNILNNNSPLAYETENIGEICDAINKLDDDIKPTINEWIAGISEKMIWLIAKEEEYVREDREFHDSLCTQSE